MTLAEKIDKIQECPGIHRNTDELFNCDSCALLFDVSNQVDALIDDKLGAM